MWETALVFGAAILGMKRFILKVAQASDGGCFVTSHRIALEVPVHSSSRVRVGAWAPAGVDNCGPCGHDFRNWAMNSRSFGSCFNSPNSLVQCAAGMTWPANLSESCGR